MADKIGTLQIELTARMDQMQSTLNSAQSKISNFGSTMTNVLGGAAVVGALATGAKAIFDFANNTLSAIDDMNDFTSALGINYNEMKNLAYAADLAGVSLDTIEGNVSKFAKTLASGKLDNMLLRFKIDKSNDPAKVMQDLLVAISEVPSQAEKAKLAFEAFAKGAIPMLKIINDSTFKDNLKEGSEINLISPANVARVAEMYDNVGRVKKNFISMSEQIAIGFVPVLQDIVTITKEMSHWFAEHGETVKSTIAKMLPMLRIYASLINGNVLETAGSMWSPDKALEKSKEAQLIQEKYMEDRKNKQLQKELDKQEEITKEKEKQEKLLEKQKSEVASIVSSTDTPFIKILKQMEKAQELYNNGDNKLGFDKPQYDRAIANYKEDWNKALTETPEYKAQEKAQKEMEDAKKKEQDKMKQEMDKRQSEADSLYSSSKSPYEKINDDMVKVSQLFREGFLTAKENMQIQDDLQTQINEQITRDNQPAITANQKLFDLNDNEMWNNSKSRINSIFGSGKASDLTMSQNMFNDKTKQNAMDYQKNIYTIILEWYRETMKSKPAYTNQYGNWNQL